MAAICKQMAVQLQVFFRLIENIVLAERKYA
jgi:hypothetical protein